jgi:hypothetical protein
MSEQPSTTPEQSTEPAGVSTAGQLNVPTSKQVSPSRPRPLQSLTASAQRLTSEHITARSGFGKAEAWQEDAWEMFDLVGEQRFLSTTLGNRLSQARMYVGRVPTNPVEEPDPIEDNEGLPARVFAFFGTSPAQRSQMISRLAINLFVAGDGWFAGIPKHMMPGAPRRIDRPNLEDLTLDELEWRMLSVSEVSFNQGQVTLRLGEDTDERVVASPDSLFLVRCWRPHPRRYWQADSPTRSSLPVLRELVGLTMSISAQVDSRLAGAGLLIVPQSAKRALQVAAGIPEDSDEDPFTEALMEAMLTPISDRSSASAVVPLVVVVPDDAADKFEHITFDKPYDEQAQSLREEAIRRLALGQDAPPELLLGTAGMNHWGAWLVREDVVTTHIEPPLALICDAITTQYLWPVLIEAGMSETEAHNYVVWYDVSHMVQRPNRLTDAITLHDKGAISDDSLREAGGFTDDDAPPRISRSVELAVQMAQANPALVDNLEQIIAAFDKVLNTPAPAAKADVPEPGQDITSTDAATQAGEAPVDESARTKREPGDLPATEGKTRASEPMPATMAIRAGLTAAADPHASDDTSVCIVATPAHPDNLPGPETKHATLVYLGKMLEPGYDEEEMATTRAAIEQAVISVVDHSGVVEADVAGVAQFPPHGEDTDPPATVVLLHSPELAAIREALLADPTIAKIVAEGDFTKYPNYRPHVTLGYGDEVSEADREVADQLRNLQFTGIELWWGTEREHFSLGDDLGPDETNPMTQGSPETTLGKVAQAADDAGTISKIVADGETK